MLSLAENVSRRSGIRADHAPARSLQAKLVGMRLAPSCLWLTSTGRPVWSYYGGPTLPV